MSEFSFSRSFAGGVISPEMFGRIDDAKYNTGAEVLRNFLVLPQGPAVNRGGTKKVREVKDSSKRTRLLKFRYSSTQTMVIELGEAYMRFHTYGGTLLTPTTGVDAWNSGDAYVPGDLVTKSGVTYYCVVGNTNEDPADPSNQYGAAPAVAGVWTVTEPRSPFIPSGYLPAGTTLPTTVEIGAKYYTTQITYDWEDVWDPSDPIREGGGFAGVPIERITYIGYTGTAVIAPSGFWMPLGEVYEIPTPYAETDLFDVHYVQSADVMTLVHPNYSPRELRRLGATKWVLSIIDFGSSLSAPTISAVTPTTATSPSDTQTYSYVATNVSEDLKDESPPSAAVTATNQLFDTGARNTITFSTPGRRNVYRLSGGIYGFIGQTTTTELIDDNIAPDISRAPPSAQDPYVSDHPGAVSYFEQRRYFGGTPLEPQTFRASKSGAESNFDRSIPVRDDDAIGVRIAAREASTIRHMVPVGDLILFTESAEWRVTSVNTDAITPTSIAVRPQSYIGASNVQPITTGTAALYEAARGGHLRTLGYSSDAEGYVSVDLALRAAHLFDYKRLVDLAYSKSPVPIAWAPSSDGRLLGVTFVPEQEVFAIHYHDTFNGLFESVCTVEEGNDDVLYAIVQRTFGENTYRFVERMEPRYFPEAKDAYFVDCGVTYSGDEETEFTGLDWLEGQTVSILADGAVQPSQVVTGGAITLEVPASVVHVGLPITADLKTLPVAMETEGYAQGRRKNVSKVTARVYRSSAFFAGPSETDLIEAKIRTDEALGSPPRLQSDEIEIVVNPEWNSNGAVVIRHTSPTPLEIISLLVELVLGS